MNTLPYLTSDLPGIGGVIKQRPGDFIVEEIPRYEPSGEGTHLYLEIEKTGITTPEAVRRVARVAGKQPRDVGYAGLKDAAAVTRQTLSIEHVDPKVFDGIDLGRLTIRQIRRHGNKLKIGHLSGNRFIVKIRDATGTLESAKKILDALATNGVPNYFGPQRFGNRGDNALIGRAVLRDDFAEALSVMLGRPVATDDDDRRRARELFDSGAFGDAGNAWPSGCDQERRICRAMEESNGDARKAWRRVDRTLRGLYLSAVQSHVFNCVVAARIDSLGRLSNGDIACKHVNKACFLVEDAAAEQKRCDAFEISPTGPMFGRKMIAPTGDPAAIESRVLSDFGSRVEDFTPTGGTRMDGTRRPLRVPLESPAVEQGGDEFGDYLEATFALPPGSYATAITREITKAEEG